ncbi:unnamed protein product, partial [Acanthoscelides obtectus]
CVYCSFAIFNSIYGLSSVQFRSSVFLSIANINRTSENASCRLYIKSNNSSAYSIYLCLR